MAEDTINPEKLKERIARLYERRHRKKPTDSELYEQNLREVMTQIRRIESEASAYTPEINSLFETKKGEIPLFNKHYLVPVSECAELGGSVYLSTTPSEKNAKWIVYVSGADKPLTENLIRKYVSFQSSLATLCHNLRKVDILKVINHELKTQEGLYGMVKKSENKMNKNNLNKQIQRNIELLIKHGCSTLPEDEIDNNDLLSESIKNIFELRVAYLNLFDKLSDEDITQYGMKIGHIERLYADIREAYRLNDIKQWRELSKQDRLDRLDEEKREKG